MASAYIPENRIVLSRLSKAAAKARPLYTYLRLRSESNR
jgi:hypothetical protein